MNSEQLKSDIVLTNVQITLLNIDNNTHTMQMLVDGDFRSLFYSFVCHIKSASNVLVYHQVPIIADVMHKTGLE